jgi:hypothetical protein
MSNCLVVGTIDIGKHSCNFQELSGIRLNHGQELSVKHRDEERLVLRWMPLSGSGVQADCTCPVSALHRDKQHGFEAASNGTLHLRRCTGTGL